MRKYITSLAVALLLTAPLAAFAISVSWDRPAAGRINPIFILDQVFGNIFTATSTTQASTFPYASTTALTISGQGAGCAQFSSNGFLSSIGVSCGTGGFSTTSADYWVSTYDKGFFFSTTSSNYWIGTYDKGFFFSTTSADYWKTQNNFFSTTSADNWKTQNNFFSTTSANYLINSSTTIPKTTLANTWQFLQTFALGIVSQASSTISALHLGTPLEVASGGTASTTLGGILTGNGTGAITSSIVSSPLTFSANTLACATCTTGGNTYGWPWTIAASYGTTTNATTTPTWYKTGMMASSTSYFVNASTSLLSAVNIWDSGLTANKLVTTDGNGLLVSSSTIGNNQLANSSIVVTTASPLGGAGTIPLGGTLALTCVTCNTSSLSGSGTQGQATYWTGASSLGSVATGTISAGTGISLDSSVRAAFGGALQITNSGVTSLTASSPISRDTATGAVTISCPTCNTSSLSGTGVVGMMTAWSGANSLVATSTVVGDAFFATSTTATSTFSGNGYFKGNLQVDGNFFAPVQIVSSGNATINGALTVTGQTTLATSLSGLAQLASGVVSAITGTTGQIPYYNGTNTVLATSTVFISTASNVGIGTTTPSRALTVTAANAAQIALTDGNSADNGWILRSISNSFYLATSTFAATSTTAAFAVNSNGVVTMQSAIVSNYFTAPSSAACPPLSLGQFCFDTTENQWQTGTSTTPTAFPAVSASHVYPSFVLSTSTPWTATSTFAIHPVITAGGEYLVGATCYQQFAGTLNIQFGSGSASSTMFNASSTANYFKFATSQFFTQGSVMYVSAGTPANTPTRVTCTTDKIYGPS